MFNKSCSDRQ